MGTSSTRAKTKYNSKTYEQINFRVKSEVAERFRVACGNDSYTVTLVRLLDEADSRKYEKLYKEYGRLCGEWDKLEKKAKQLFDENKKLKDELKEERKKSFFELVKAKFFG